MPPRMKVISDVDEDTIIQRIEEAEENSHFVIVDLEGTASRIGLYAIAQADFVIVPTQGSVTPTSRANKLTALANASRSLASLLAARRFRNYCAAIGKNVIRPHPERSRTRRRSMTRLTARNLVGCDSHDPNVPTVPGDFGGPGR